MERALVGIAQSIDSRQDDALYRARDLLIRGVFGAAQQLFEEQRVALGAFDAGAGEAVGGFHEFSGQAQRLVFAKRRQIDGDKRGRGRLAPRAVQRVALDARGHDQDHRPLCGRRRHHGEMVQRRRVGPVQVLDHH